VVLHFKWANSDDVSWLVNPNQKCFQWSFELSVADVVSYLWRLIVDWRFSHRCLLRCKLQPSDRSWLVSYVPGLIDRDWIIASCTGTVTCLIVTFFPIFVSHLHPITLAPSHSIVNTWLKFSYMFLHLIQSYLTLKSWKTNKIWKMKKFANWSSCCLVSHSTSEAH